MQYIYMYIIYICNIEYIMYEWEHVELYLRSRESADQSSMVPGFTRPRISHFITTTTVNIMTYARA